MGLVYDSRELSGVTIARSEVAGVLQSPTARGQRRRRKIGRSR
jgi:hypothetical protein